MGSTEIKLKYVVPDHVKDIFVTGAFGGFTSAKFFHLSLYTDRPSLPPDITVTVDDNGKIIDQRFSDQPGFQVRYVQGSFIMDYSTAIAIRDWLIQSISSIGKIGEGQDGTSV
ncbi:MAG: hypothetical protein AB1641_21000 [Thermodesulfobacteriota bacterium]